MVLGITSITVFFDFRLGNCFFIIWNRMIENNSFYYVGDNRVWWKVVFRFFFCL